MVLRVLCQPTTRRQQQAQTLRLPARVAREGPLKNRQASTKIETKQMEIEIEIDGPDQRFIVLRVTFSIGPPMCAANLFVKTSESRKRWSGRRSGCAADGFGSAWYAGDAFGSVGLCAGALRMFFGICERGGECRTSVCGDYEAPPRAHEVRYARRGG